MHTSQLPFFEFMSAVHKSKPRPSGLFRGRLLALDPGETTGWSIWDYDNNQYNMTACGQLNTWDKENHMITPCVDNFPMLLSKYAFIDHVAMESYRVYSWKTESHEWSDVPTLRIIGSIETRLMDSKINYTMQTAQQAKNFVTDDLLKQWGFYDKGQRHSRDSMRHALYFLLFGK